MNSSQMMALMPILTLSLTAMVLMIQASIKRDQNIAWWITAAGFLLHSAHLGRSAPLRLPAIWFQAAMQFWHCHLAGARSAEAVPE